MTLVPATALAEKAPPICLGGDLLCGALDTESGLCGTVSGDPPEPKTWFSQYACVPCPPEFCQIV